MVVTDWIMGTTKLGLNKLGEIIRSARGDLSLTEFSNITGVGYMTISRLEKATFKPDIEVLDKLANYTDYTVEQLCAIAVGKQDPKEVREILRGEDAYMALRKMPRPEIKKLIFMLAKELSKDERKEVLKEIIDIT